MTASGRIYSEEVLDKAIAELMGDMTPPYVVLGEPDMTQFVNMKHVIGVCEDIKKEAGYYTASVRILINRIPEEALKVCKLHPCGIGTLEKGVEGMNVTSFSMKCLYVDR
jgi:hypothetical protein